MKLSLELSKLLEQHLKLLKEEGEQQNELHDEELFERELDDSLLHVLDDEELKLLLLFEKLFEDELKKLLEQQGLSQHDVGKLPEELLDQELCEEQLEEKLLLFSLDDKLTLLQLYAILLTLELLLLLVE